MEEKNGVPEEYMKSNFTPGPWSLVAKRDHCDEYYCVLEPIGLHIHDKIADDDAFLLAAAPDLYVALEEIITQIKIGGSKCANDLREKAVFALEKARGERE